MMKSETIIGDTDFLVAASGEAIRVHSFLFGILKIRREEQRFVFLFVCLAD